MGIARFAMRGPGQATGLTLLSAVLIPFVPPVLYLSGGLVTLVSLQLGLKNGIVVAGGATLALAGLTMLATSTALPGLAMGIAVWGPAALVAEAVRGRGSLRVGLQWLSFVGLAALVVMYAVVPEPAAWWEGRLTTYLADPEIEGLLSAQAPEPAEIAENLAPLMPGLIGVLAVTTLGFSLLLGRFWQAALYRPGAFSAEFQELRFGRLWGAVFAALFMAGLAGVLPAGNFAAVLVVLFALQGLAILHRLVRVYGVHWLWLALVYGVLVIALPQMAVVLAVVGAADNWLDFRARASQGGSAGS